MLSPQPPSYCTLVDFSFLLKLMLCSGNQPFMMSLCILAQTLNKRWNKQQMWSWTFPILGDFINRLDRSVLHNLRPKQYLSSYITAHCHIFFFFPWIGFRSEAQFSECKVGLCFSEAITRRPQSAGLLTCKCDFSSGACLDILCRIDEDWQNLTCDLQAHGPAQGSSEAVLMAVSLQHLLWVQGCTLFIIFCLCVF